MVRHWIALMVSFVSVAVVSANGAPRPLPQKVLPVLNVLAFENEIAGYSFYLVLDVPKGQFNVVQTVTKLAPVAGKPLALAVPKTALGAVVYAVPTDLAKTYKTTREFLNGVSGAPKNWKPGDGAVGGRPPKGVVYLSELGGEALGEPNDKRTSLRRVFAVTGGGKEAVKFTEVPEAKKDPSDPKKDPEDPEPEPAAVTRPAPRLMVVGIAAALALSFAGAWLVRRK